TYREECKKKHLDPSINFVLLSKKCSERQKTGCAKKNSKFDDMESEIAVYYANDKSKAVKKGFSRPADSKKNEIEDEMEEKE
ncbi:hypothetical protein J0S82_011889, partial [Galemys pyrenaicus]